MRLYARVCACMRLYALVCACMRLYAPVCGTTNAEICCGENYFEAHAVARCAIIFEEIEQTTSQRPPEHSVSEIHQGVFKFSSASWFMTT